MSHVYINTSINEDFENILLSSKNKETIYIADNEINIYYDNQLWGRVPVINNHEDGILFVSGWFVNSDYELNNLDKLFDDIKKTSIKDVVDNLIAGVFVAGYFDGCSFNIFCDPFGLTPHFYSLNKKVMVSPSAIDHNTNSICDELSGFLAEQGHLFGKYTKYKDIYKFIPGDVLSVEFEKVKYTNNGFKINDNGYSVTDIIKLSKKLISSFPEEALSTALSAGFDSRLLFMVSNTQYTYTWGQETSLDVVNGTKLALSKNIDHLSFDFRMNKIKDKTKEICDYLFDGSVISYNNQFFENYKYVEYKSKVNYIALDGYLGDVLQRGVYMNHGGKKGEFLKLFPNLSSVLLDSKKLLNYRYSKVEENKRKLVIEDFYNKKNEYSKLDELQKVTYYEFLYGRGLRYITTASINMNGLFKTVVPVFASRYIFSVLIQQKESDTLTYKTFHKIWKSSEKLERELKSEGFYSPATTPILIPFINIYGRLVTNLHPKHLNYTKK